MNNIQFCNPDSVLSNDLINLVSEKIIHLDKLDIKMMYENWYQNFDTEKSFDFDRKKSFLPVEFKIPEDACCLGVDFPSWLNFESNRKRIMLVGIDPLRNEQAFKGFNIHDDVLIGTPYALHHQSMREGRTKEYWKFINLLSTSFSLYLTDIYKVFYYRGNYQGKRSYLDLSSKGRDVQEEILKAEITLIKPDIIIAMGDRAVKLLTKQKKLVPSLIHTNITESTFLFGNNIPVIPMVHLSGGSYENHKQAFLFSNKESGKNYGELYFKIINNYLSNVFSD